MLRAVIWDVDGTLAETERDGHRIAFNQAFERCGLAWRWDSPTYGRLLAVAGGYERLMSDLSRHDDAPTDPEARAALARRLHDLKNAAYATLVAKGGIALRPGVRRLLDEGAAAGVMQAIATTTSRANVVALLAGALGPAWERRFAAIVCAEDAPSKKPDPLVYRIALQRLGVDPSEAVAIEDSPNGVDAARAAGLAVLVTRSDYFRDADCAATATCDDLDSPLEGGGIRSPRVDIDGLRSLIDPGR